MIEQRNILTPGQQNPGRRSMRLCCLKGQGHEIFDPYFLQNTPPGPLTSRLKKVQRTFSFSQIYAKNEIFVVDTDSNPQFSNVTILAIGYVNTPPDFPLKSVRGLPNLLTMSA